MFHYKKLIATISIAALCSFHGMGQSKISNTIELISTMHSKYAKSWYESVTFSQRAIFYKNGQVDREEIWHEAIKMPDKLIIKFNKMDGGEGILFMADSQYVFKENRIVQSGKKIHDLMVLGFSVYNNSPEVTLGKMKECGFDIDKFTVETQDDSTFYVVGSDEARFWIESKTLLFTKLQKRGKDGTLSEVIFKEYIPLKGGWIETEVLFLRSGKLNLRELYYDVQSPKKLSNDLFKIENFAGKKW